MAGSLSAPRQASHVRSLACPNCGGTVELRGMGRAVRVVCIQCLTVLDATTPSLVVVERFTAAQRYQPKIPLGTRGKMRGDPYEVIGFQVRELHVEGVAYQWSEYVLFNPYKGFRYLSEYNGHWNDITILHSLPTVAGGSRPAAHLLGENYKHFQHYEAQTVFVMGEFPWQVRVGEKAVCDDYISPPRILSSETTDNEVTWSLGEYLNSEDLWKNFGLKGSPPPAQGVFANMPSPHGGKAKQALSRFFFWFLVVLGIQIFFAVFHSNQRIFSQKYIYPAPGGATEQSFVTPEFDVKGRPSTVKVSIDTDLDNNWAFFNLALINTETGIAYDFSRQVSYYHGREGGENWSEGGKRENVVLATVPGGRYYLRVEPEVDAETPRVAPSSFSYQIDVRRDVTTWGYFLFAVILLVIPMLWTVIRSATFEGKRWSESDYSGSSSSSGGDDK